MRWEEFRQNMLPAYERLAASPRHLDIMPSPRPTNYARNIYHVSNAAYMVCLRSMSPRSSSWQDSWLPSRGAARSVDASCHD